MLQISPENFYSQPSPYYAQPYFFPVSPYDLAHRRCTISTLSYRACSFPVVSSGFGAIHGSLHLVPWVWDTDSRKLQPQVEATRSMRWIGMDERLCIPCTLT